MDQSMFGDPIDPSVIPLPDGTVVLLPYWQYSVKRSGVRRSRMCANGSKKATPTLHAVASTWSSCVELQIQRLFLGIFAALNLIVYRVDTIDAYAHSPALDSKMYSSVDDTYEEWWNSTAKERDKPPITRKFVLPVRHCLQGHPRSGVQ